ncbi:olfactory receptor 51G2-like [Pelodiscus sinensis]|uniref:olfactory receptor 51G2-like n=1 Tax=Pelodiscus sinensis TaxID=13735 RepID=UPI003F6D141C
MLALNDTRYMPAVFLLTGLEGHEDIHIWIAIPLCLIYAILIIGNTGILFIIKTDSSLHEPMYIFLSMLAVTDLGLAMTTMPTILGVFLFNSREISFDACFAQVFFVHALAYVESSVLLSMAFDRFTAIHDPLRYASILTLPRIAKMGLVCVIRGVALQFPFPFLLKRFQYWRANVVSHSYCMHNDVMKLAYADITVNNIYGFFIILSTVGLDSFLIFVSYVMILKTVLSVASHGERIKALNTCVSHLCAVLLFYVPMVSQAVLRRFGNSSTHWLQIFFGYIYVLVPPLMNPIVYSVKSKQLRVRIIRVFIN